MGQALVHREGLVGRGENFANGCAEHHRHALAAIFLGQVKRRPATFAHLIKGIFKSAGRANDAVFQMTAFGIANYIERHQHF